MTPASTVLVSALLLGPAAAPGTRTSPDAPELRALLTQFLAGASRDDAATHERFWADELIYTGSSGRRIGKADIMKDVRAPSPAPSPSAKPEDDLPVYTAEDVRIQQYGDTAVVAFRLVGTSRRDGRPHVSKYLNTGTFVKRAGQWRAVAWQATRVPRTEEEARPEVAAAESKLRQALLDGDAKVLEPLLDKDFVWSQGPGEEMTRQALMDALASGKLKYVKLATTPVSLSLYGETAVVRTVSQGQRTMDSAPFTTPYTLTLVDRGEGWKAVALQGHAELTRSE